MKRPFQGRLRHEEKATDHGAGKGRKRDFHAPITSRARGGMQRRDRSYAERQLRVTNYELQVTNAETPKLEARKMERVRGGLRVAERLALMMLRYGTAQEQWHTSSVAPGCPPIA